MLSRGLDLVEVGYVDGCGWEVVVPADADVMAAPFVMDSEYPLSWDDQQAKRVGWSPCPAGMISVYACTRRD